MKKLLSALLTLALVLSLIPAVYAAEAAIPVKETYTFNTSAIQLAQSTLVSKIDGDAVDKNGKNIYETYGWKYFDMADKILQNQSTSGNIAAVKGATNGLIFYLNGKNSGNLLFALVLKTPEYSSFYIPSVEWTSGSGSQSLKWFLSIEDEDKSAVEDYSIDENLIMSKTGVSADDYKGAKAAVADSAIYLSPDQTVVSAMQSGDKNYKFYSITLNPILNPIMTTTVNEANSVSFDLTDGDTTNDTAIASASVSGDNQATAMPVSNNFITYHSYDKTIAEVDEKTGVITPKDNGSTTVWAETSDGVKSTPVTVNVTAPAEEPEEDEPLVDEFVKDEEKAPITDYVPPSVTAITLNGQTIEAEPGDNGSYNFTAPATKGDNKFLYWAMGLVGNKRIISFSETLENYLPEGNYRNYLVPVYEGDVAADKKEFYNQNGQLIPNADETTTVSMPGYGSTNIWKQYGETNIYVADYGKTKDERDKVTVTAVGGKVNGKDEASILFGTEVTCTAENEDATDNPFKCWKKSNINGDEIVSVDKTYKFKVWEKCTVTAVYEEHTPISNAMKIIIDDFAVDTGVTGVMAEFIGFDGDDITVVEKGIKFTDSTTGKETKIAMTTTDNQFTVIADKPGTYVGYAILKNGEIYNLITDGLFTK